LSDDVQSPGKISTRCFLFEAGLSVIPPSAVMTLGLMVPAAKAQAVIDSPSGFTGATGHAVLQNSLVSGSI
jgi:hypothetical protein